MTRRRWGTFCARPIWRALVIGFLLFLTSAARAQDTNSSNPTFFYRQPSAERAAQIIHEFNQSAAADKPNAQNAMAGFFAAVFLKYPGSIDKFVREDLKPLPEMTIAIALHLANQDQRATAQIARLKKTGVETPDLKELPDELDSVQAGGAATFDLLWGASFATGDPKYCKKILDRYAAFANEADHAKDMVLLQKDENNARSLVDKYGREKFIELVMVASALWSLSSNAHNTNSSPPLSINSLKRTEIRLPLKG